MSKFSFASRVTQYTLLHWYINKCLQFCRATITVPRHFLIRPTNSYKKLNFEWPSSASSWTEHTLFLYVLQRTGSVHWVFFFIFFFGWHKRFWYNTQNLSTYGFAVAKFQMIQNGMTCSNQNMSWKGKKNNIYLSTFNGKKCQHFLFLFLKIVRGPVNYKQ